MQISDLKDHVLRSGVELSDHSINKMAERNIVVEEALDVILSGEIIEEYPDLESEDIRQSLEYASWLARDRVFTERLEAAG